MTVFSGNPASSVGFVLPDETLAPGEFRQFSGILHSNGMQIDQGYARVEKVAGTAHHYAYGVINDQVTSDGSFVPPVKRDATVDEPTLNIPVVVESGEYSTELILTNRNNAPITLPSATSRTLSATTIGRPRSAWNSKRSVPHSDRH